MTHDENVRAARPPPLQLWRTGVAGEHVCNPSPGDRQVQRVTREGIMTSSGAVDRSDNVTVEFDRSCTTSCQSAIVSIALYDIFELFDVEEHRDLEI